MNKKQLDTWADELDQAQARENGELGVQCVRSMVLRLRQGDFDWAQSIRASEGDKTRVHPKLEALLLKIFGCRPHRNEDCQDSLCMSLKGYLQISLMEILEDDFKKMMTALEEDL